MYRICTSSNGRRPTSDAEIDEILKIASDGDITALVELSFTKEVDVTTACNTDGVTTLHEAARSGNSKLVKMLIDAKSVVDSKDSHGTTPLHIAATNGYVRVVKELVKADAAIDARDNFGVTPLHVAAKNGHKKAIKVLVQANALVDTEDVYGWTPLASAVVNDSSDIIKYLVKDAGADRSKVKYQFQNRIGVLIGEIEPSVERLNERQQQDTSPAQAPRQENVHLRSNNVAIEELTPKSQETTTTNEPDRDIEHRVETSGYHVSLKNTTDICPPAEEMKLGCCVIV